MAETELGPITDDAKAEIARLLLEGRRVSDVIAHGLTRGRENGWRRPHVVALITERGWSLDSDGRIPRRYRTQQIPPATALPGQAPPEPPRGRAVEFPPEGTVTEGRGANSAAALIAVGKQHAVPAIVRLAERAEAVLDELVKALKDDEQNAVLRNRLAQLEAEAQALRSRLGVKKRGRPAGSTTRREPGKRAVTPPADGAEDKPIKHGTWGGYRAESMRGIEHCEACQVAKDEQVARMQAGRAAQLAAASS